MIIYGAGMAGLVTAQMMRRHQPVVREAQGSLPSNHGALLRFRSDAVTRATGLPLRRVAVLKAICRDHILSTTTSLADANAYAAKVTGSVAARSILDLAPCERYIAPDDFLADLAAGATIAYGHPLVGIPLTDGPIISTIPMPALMAIVGWPNVPEFRSRRVGSLNVEIVTPDVDVFQTIYYPYDEPWYRASLTGRRLIIEFVEEDADEFSAAFRSMCIGRVLRDFGISNSMTLSETSYKVQRYGKLLSIPERTRRAFILAMTEEYGIYSVGRFATWRQILLDDVVQDVRVVESMITARDDYARAKLKV